MKNKKASVLGVTLIVLGVILLIALSVSTVSVQERKASISSSSSSQAYQVAESGIEKIMDEIIKGGYSTVNQISSGSCNTSTGLIESSGYKVELRGPGETKIACNSTASIGTVENIKSTGKAGQNSRAIEAAVAAASPVYGFQCMSGVSLGSFPWCLRWDITTGAATIKMSGNWALSSTWTTVSTVFSATTPGQYGISCTQGNPGGNLPFCVRINIQTGETEFKKANDWALSGWTTQTAPFAASTSGAYAISCVRYEAGYSQDNCCRMDLISGVSECKGASDGNHTSWANRNNPF